MSRFYPNTAPSFEEWSKKRPTSSFDFRVKDVSDLELVTLFLQGFPDEMPSRCMTIFGKCLRKALREYPAATGTTGMKTIDGTVYVGSGGITAVLVRIIEVLDSLIKDYSGIILIESSSSSVSDEKEEIIESTMIDSSSAEGTTSLTSTISDHRQLSHLTLLVNELIKCFPSIIIDDKVSDGLIIRISRLRLALANLVLQYARSSLERTEKGGTSDLRTLVLGLTGAQSYLCVALSLQGSKLLLTKKINKELNDLVKRICEQSEEVMKQAELNLEYELLFGVAGYLSALNLVSEYTNDYLTSDISSLLNDTRRMVCDGMISAGVSYAGLLKKSADPGIEFSMMYIFRQTLYLGAAHGICGVLQSLLRARIIDQKYLIDSSDAIDSSADSKRLMPSLTDSQDSLIRKSLEECRDQLRVSAGVASTSEISAATPSAATAARERGPRNYAATLLEVVDPVHYGEEDPSECMVHWCHGAPGFSLMFATAAVAYRNDDEDPLLFHEHMNETCHVVWNQGLLKKGPGLCHGIPGNGYCFLQTFQVTADLEQYYRSLEFARFLCFDTSKDFWKRPDTPHSLFEGGLGAVMFLLDCLYAPSTARFPCF